MIWVELVTILVVLQFVAFGILVGMARHRHGIQAPATSGHPQFECYFRVHMNTLETLVVLLPSMWIAAQFWSPRLCAALGAVYLVGRMMYLRAYVSSPKTRALGYNLSITPALVLALAALVGIVRQLIRAGGMM